MFDKDQVRKSMLLQKSYFHDLFSSNSLTCGTILASGSILNLNTLIKVLHFITIGEIPLSNQAIERLTKSRKAHFLHKKFKQKKLVRNLLNSNRQEKISVLVKVQKFLPDLLERLVSLKFASHILLLTFFVSTVCLYPLQKLLKFQNLQILVQLNHHQLWHQLPLQTLTT